MLRVRAALMMLAAVVVVLVSGLAHAAAGPTCTIPANLPVPHEEGPTERDPQRVLPIGYYTLAMIWMPQKCRKGGDDCDLYQATGYGRRDGLTLHGLWPDGKGREWPQYCAAAPVLPAKTIAAHLCATPSPQLMQHEWTKHGTCMQGYTPDR